MNRKEVAKVRAEKRVCLICEASGVVLSRGLCRKHYQRYVRHRKSLPNESERERFDFECMENGLLLESVQGKRPESEDEFEAIAARITAERLSKEAIREINEVVERFEKPKSQKVKR